jgi:hypothetical protein
VVHAHHLKENKSLQTMEQLSKAGQARNTPIIVSNQVMDLKKEQEIILEWKINHTLLGLVSNLLGTKRSLVRRCDPRA